MNLQRKVRDSTGDMDTSVEPSEVATQKEKKKKKKHKTSEQVDTSAAEAMEAVEETVASEDTVNRTICCQNIFVYISVLCRRLLKRKRRRRRTNTKRKKQMTVELLFFKLTYNITI